MLSGFFFAFAVLRYGVTKWRETFINTSGFRRQDRKAGGTGPSGLLMVEAIVLMGWWLWQVGGE